jgi:riboflavin transporter FmnP
MQSQTLSAKRIDTKRLVILSMFAAISYIAVFLLRIPVFASFLDYELKSVIIALAGFIFGPSAVIIISIPVCLLEMVTISHTGFIGAFMNIIATIAFALPAALMYKKKRTLGNAVMGLILGTVALTVAMVLWNYLITPLYMGVPREEVAKMLLPVFAPFNILKGSLNASLTFLLYTPLIRVLRKARFIPPSEKEEVINQKSAVTANIIAGIIMLAGIIVIIVFKK